MKNLTVASRLMVSAFLSLLLLSSALVYSLLKQSELAELTHKQHLHPFTVSNAVARADAAANRADHILEVLVHRTAPEEIAKLEAELQGLDASLQSDLQLARERFLGDKRDFDELIDLHKRAMSERLKLAAMKKSGESAETLTRLHEVAGKQAESVGAAHRKVYEFALAKADAFQKGADESRDGALRYTVSIGLLVAILAIAASIYVSRSISRPIAEAAKAANAIAAGRLDVEITSSGRDEISHLMGALEAMRVSLLRVVTEVRNSAVDMATSIDQIASTSHDLEDRTRHQVSALEQIASTMEELSSTSSNTADSAHQASEVAEAAAATADRGGQAVNEVVQTMLEMGKSAKRMADIIGVIDGIAFQTNILSLNAAVEAARAGPEGRGFAVVAGEVRTLAKRSTEAASEIRSLISTSVERMQAGSTLAQGAGKTMEEVVTAIGRVSEIARSISHTASEQKSGVLEASSAVALLDKTAQENSSLVQSAASSAKQVSADAAHLVSAVNHFQLEA